MPIDLTQDVDTDFASGKPGGIKAVQARHVLSDAIEEIYNVNVNLQTGDYTLTLTDGAGVVIEMDSDTANSVTVPPNSAVAFPSGRVIEICQVGVGQTTIVAAAGVTIHTASSMATRTQWSTVALRKRGADEWVLSGDLTGGVSIPSPTSSASAAQTLSLPSQAAIAGEVDRIVRSKVLRTLTQSFTAKGLDRISVAQLLGALGQNASQSAPSGSFAITSAGQRTGPNSSTTNTFSSLVLPAGSGFGSRIVQLSAGVYGTTITGATIDTGSGPVAMVLDTSVTSASADLRLFHADAGTASTATVVITTVAAAGAGINLTWDIINTNASFPWAVYQQDASGFAAISQSLSVPSDGGGVVAVMQTAGGGALSWTNATHEETAAVASGYVLDQAKVTATGAVTVGYPTSNQLFVGATWSAVPTSGARSVAVSQALRALNQSSLAATGTTGGGETVAQAIVRQTIGPVTITKADVQAFGSIGASLINVFEYYSNFWTSYDQDFASGFPNNDPTRAMIPSQSGGNFYDKATAYYQYFAMTGNINWKLHADALVADTKAWVYVPYNYTHWFTPGWMNPRSMYIDYLLNGHADSLAGIGKFADYINAGALAEITTHPHHDAAGISSFGGRELGRCFQAACWADFLGLSSTTGRNFASDRSAIREALLGYWIDSNGAVRPNNSWRNKIYQNGIISEGLIDDFKLTVKAGGTPDSRIIPAIRRMIDYGWNVHWRGRFGGNTYLDGPNTEDQGALSAVFANINAFPGCIAWWLGSQLGAGTTTGRAYIDMGDRWFIEGLQENIMAGFGQTPYNTGKSWNEFIALIFSYLADRMATGIPFPTSSRNWIDKPWGSPQTFTLSGTGTQTQLWESPVYGIWNCGLRARARILASVASGTKTAFLQILNGSFEHGGTVAPQKPITVTTTPAWVGYSDEVLIPDGDGSIRLMISDGNDGLGSRSIIIHDVDLGAGDSRWDPPAEPNLQTLIAPSYTSAQTVGPRISINGTLTTSPNAIFSAGAVLGITNGTYETVASPAPASFIYDWWLNGQLIPGANSQTLNTSGLTLATGDGIYGRETPVSAASVAGRPNTTLEVNLNALT